MQEAALAPISLELEAPVADVLVHALLQAIDDLEARALLAEADRTALGRMSAREYRVDRRRLQRLLDQLRTDCRAPDPHQVAVQWIDGTYAIHGRRPVRLIPQDDLEALLESTQALIDLDLLAPHDAFDALLHLVHHGLSRPPSHLIHNTEQTSLPQLESATTTTETSTRLTHPAAHRLAPGCPAAADGGGKAGDRPC